METYTEIPPLTVQPIPPAYTCADPTALIHYLENHGYGWLPPASPAELACMIHYGSLIIVYRSGGLVLCGEYVQAMKLIAPLVTVAPGQLQAPQRRAAA